MTAPSERAKLRWDIRAALGAMPDADTVADELMPIIRAAQADAWLRGWAAGIIAHHKGTAGIVPATPYSGGRHAAFWENPVPALGPEVFDGQVWHRTNLLPGAWIMP